MTDKRIIKYPTKDLIEHSNSYQVRFRCDNCGEWENYRLPKGTPQKGIKIDCENCGCEGEL